MKKIVFLSTVIIAFLCLNIGEIKAQESGALLVIEKVSPTDSLVLANARPHEPRPIPAPKFMLKSKNNNFMMTLSGWTSMLVGADIKNDLYKTSAGTGFIPADLALTTTRVQKSEFYINPLGGVLRCHIVGLAGTKNEISAFIKL